MLFAQAPACSPAAAPCPTNQGWRGEGGRLCLEAPPAHSHAQPPAYAPVYAPACAGSSGRRARAAAAAEESESYLGGGVRYDDTKLLDEGGEAVMMEWERPLMERHADIICRSVSPRGRVYRVHHTMCTAGIGGCGWGPADGVPRGRRLPFGERYFYFYGWGCSARPAGVSACVRAPSPSCRTAPLPARRPPSPRPAARPPSPLPQGGDVLNVGFGMGIVDAAIQRRSPRTHTIVEAHPGVHARMLADGWGERPGVRVVLGRWQDVVAEVRA